MQAEVLPHEAERVRIVEGLDLTDIVADGLAQHRARRLAEAVDAEDRGAIEGRWKIGRGGVRQMMRDEVKPLLQRPSKNPIDSAAHLAEPQQEDLLEPGIRPPFGAISLSAL